MFRSGFSIIFDIQIVIGIQHSRQALQNLLVGKYELGSCPEPNMDWTAQLITSLSIELQVSILKVGLCTREPWHHFNSQCMQR